MNFDERQTKIIYEFIMRYNADEEFRNNVQKLYNNDIGALSILHIYALEEIIRHGAKGVFNELLELKGNHSEKEIVDLFEGFINLLNENENFRQYKLEQYENFPETLSEMEKFALNLTTKSKNEEETTDSLEYDPVNLILYATDFLIRETLENLFIGEFIHKMLELPEMQEIKNRQKEDGRIANIDKPFIIEKVQEVIFTPDSLADLKKIIDSRYIKVKFDVLLGKGELAFKEYLPFNTNICIWEILGSRVEELDEEKDAFELLRDRGINLTFENNHYYDSDTVIDGRNRKM